MPKYIDTWFLFQVREFCVEWFEI
ncbi:hypothetical protein PITCH_A1530017 [uncultured Desulfobacterium sp.]|uniref:Uncharacterized protein n=1 Tax=uncultured Desulfobacterium sp. TaxID=201089 RepID=A0A445MTH1_9BACT|nr:hypothetical protein PITCH_A1530017 [uncultured Desulfobacterium sp.]